MRMPTRKDKALIYRSSAMYINLSHICRVVSNSPLFSCLCELCSSHRLMVEGLRNGVKETGFLTQRDLNKISETRELVRSGKPLFENITVVVPREKIEKVTKEPTDKEVKALDKKWKEGKEGTRNKVIFDLSHPNSPAKEWFPEDQSSKQDQNKLYCSFCRSEVSSSRATFGRGPIRFTDKFETISVDPRVVKKTTIVTSDKLVACPNCCLKIKPKIEESCSTCYCKEKDCKCETYKPVRKAIHSNIRTHDEG